VSIGYIGDIGVEPDAAPFLPNDGRTSAAAIEAQNSNNLLIQHNCARTLDMFGGTF
jgi:hypothetical protein